MARGAAGADVAAVRPESGAPKAAKPVAQRVLVISEIARNLVEIMMMSLMQILAEWAVGLTWDPRCRAVRFATRREARGGSSLVHRRG